jgi:hypothetical protein
MKIKILDYQNAEENYKLKMKNFKPVFGNDNHIKIVKLIGEISDFKFDLRENFTKSVVAERNLKLFNQIISLL